jgi:hypothetical protein
MSTTPTTPNLPGLTPGQVNGAVLPQWRALIKQALADARCASPAFLVENLGADQTVTVQIAIQERVRTLTGQQWWDVPPIIKVPILIPRGGGFSMTLPLKTGDQGMLIFCDTCFDNWWQNGQTQAPTAANVVTKAKAAGITPVPSGSQIQLEVRRHHVHDCGFLPGMYSQNNVLANYSTDSLQIRSDDGDTVIDVAEAGVTVTGGTVTVNGSTAVAVNGPTITAANGGPALPLVNDNFYQWFIDTFMPSVTYKAAQPTPPTDPETTVLKGQ